MLDGVMLLWFILTGLSLLFVAIDIRNTPEATVLKWGFLILTAFTGPFGAFFYVLGCREPLPGLHEQYVASTWRQVLGSTMHCAAGDGLGIIAGATVSSLLKLDMASALLFEYLLGFGFGWAYFQAYAMRDMAGGSYIRSLQMTFMPEFFSMNMLMAGMILVSKLTLPAVAGSDSPFSFAFWFFMSMALLIGFLCAYPMNWYLVTRNLKHGMVTTRRPQITDQQAFSQTDLSAGHPSNANIGMNSYSVAEEHKQAGPHSGHQTSPMASTSGADHAPIAEMVHGENAPTVGVKPQADYSRHGGGPRPTFWSLAGVGVLSVTILATSLVIVLTLRS